MKSAWNYLTGVLVALMTSWPAAVFAQTEEVVREATVNPMWIVVFLALFVVFCVWIGVGIYRADKASKAGAGKS